VKKFFAVLLLVLSMISFSQAQVFGLATQVSNHSAELDLNAGGKATSRVGNGSGYYHMLVNVDLTGQTLLLPCTLAVVQVPANVGAFIFDYPTDSFKTTVSSVICSSWANGSAQEDPEEGSVCWHERAYSATAPVYWIAGNTTSTLASVSKGQGGSHVNSTGVYLNTAASGLESYVVLDSVLVADLANGAGGLLIYRAAGQQLEMKFSTNNIQLRWDPNGRPLSAEKGASLRSFALQAFNRPNPFRPGTTISFSGADAASLIRIFDVSGTLVKTLRGESGSVFWNGADEQGVRAPAGTYVYSISEGKSRIVRQMQLIK